MNQYKTKNEIIKELDEMIYNLELLKEKLPDNYISNILLFLETDYKIVRNINCIISEMDKKLITKIINLKIIDLENKERN